MSVRAIVATLVALVAAQTESAFTSHVFTFTATDGTVLEAKLSVPARATGPVPVVFMLHGAGPRAYDHAVLYRDSTGAIRSQGYYDFYAEELAKRGLGFFRVSKRGVTLDSTGRAVVDRAVFGRTTPALLVDDYARALAALRGRKDIDASRIVLMGTSEGTRLAPQLAARAPAGIAGLVLLSYQADNLRNTVTWQNVTGPWRNIEFLLPAASDGVLTLAEYEAATSRNAQLRARLPFNSLDVNGDGEVRPNEMAALNKPRLDALTKAVADGDDELLWRALANLTSAYLKEDWDGPPTHELLLRLSLPVGIFHGAGDGTTRVEGVRETEAAYRAAGKSELTVRIYPGYDHDLNWVPERAASGGSQAYQDAFDFAATLVQTRTGRLEDSTPK